MSESKVQREIIDYLEKGGHYVIKTVRTNKKGTPDILLCTQHDGKFIAIEVKAKGEKKAITSLQKLHIELINKTGGKAFVADSLYDVIEEGL